jgi:phosphomannomutase
MLGVLLADHLLQQTHAFVPIVCSTIVSSNMLQRIAEAAGADYYQTLTGFKWLSNVALEHEDDQHQFLFAYEEAIGYACGRQVRDKDGLSALLAFAQLAQGLADRGETVLDQLEQLYRQHGLFLTGQRSIALQPGAPSVGELLRADPPEQIAGSPVVQMEDLNSGIRQYADGRTEKLEFPPSDVLIYRLENKAMVIVRPSGTEPKLKCYYEVVERIPESAVFDTAMAQAQAALDELAASHQQAIAALLGQAT